MCDFTPQRSADLAKFDGLGGVHADFMCTGYNPGKR
jgi:hypothetical protein